MKHIEQEQSHTKKIHNFLFTVLPVKFDKEITSESLPHTAQVAMFECLAKPSPLYGDEIPPCLWYHNDELIDISDDKYELISDGNKHVLKVTKI